MNKYILSFSDKLDESKVARNLVEALSGYTPQERGKFVGFIPLPIPESEIPQNDENPVYQIFIMNTKEDNWMDFGKPSSNISALEVIMGREVKKNGAFSGLIARTSDWKVFSWLWR